MKKLISLIVAIIMFASTGAAQIVTTSPALLQQSSSNVVLTYHADSPLGNNDLKGVTASDPVYAHIGVITNKSDGQWAYAPAWKDNSAKYKLNYVTANTWSLNIGDIRTYFGITDATEQVQKIALVFRNGTATKQGKTKDGGDIFVDVFEEGFQMLFSTTATSTILSSAQTLTFNAVTSQNAQISIAVNGLSVASVASGTTLTGSYNFSKHGSYEVTATAVSGSQTVTKTLNVAFPGQSTAGTYPGGVPKMGAVKNADGSVTFCFAAPGKSSVVLVPSWDDYKVLDKNIMKYQDYNGYRYFFTTVSGLDNNTDYPYYYLVDAQYKVADPYARLVLDNYSDKYLDKSIWPDMPRYPYDKFDDVILAVYNGSRDTNFSFSDFTIPEHNNLVIYEMLFRDFTGTEGASEGNGTIRKAIEKFEHIRSLGVNAVELMPVMEFNGNNSWGYNPNFYFAPDKAYGSPEDLKEFIELCHRHGIAVILDIVFNQSDGLHPWYRMYDINSNPFYNKTAPHDYSVLNDWKQENPLVRQQWKDVIKYWMTVYNVDGFRFDLVKGLGTSYPSGTEAYNSTRIATMKDLHQAIKEVKPNGIHINENLAGSTEENEMAADGQLNWGAGLNNNSCQYAMGNAGGASLSRYLSTNDSRTAYSTVAYAENHDEERMGYRQNTSGISGVKGNVSTSMKRLGAVAVQLLMTPGPKMIWQFGELGADQTTKTSSGNDTSPKKVIWSYLDNSDRAALCNTYKALGWLRRSNPDMFNGNATFTYKNVDQNNIAVGRTMRLVRGSSEIIAFINPKVTGATPLNISSEATSLSAANSQLICASPGFTGSIATTSTGVSCRVPSNGYAVFATNDLAGVEEVISDNSDSVTVIGGVGEIIIVGEYHNATVYNLSGAVMPSLNVAAGLYIVNVDGKASKVLVR